MFLHVNVTELVAGPNEFSLIAIIFALELGSLADYLTDRHTTVKVSAPGTD